MAYNFCLLYVWLYGGQGSTNIRVNLIFILSYYLYTNRDSKLTGVLKECLSSRLVWTSVVANITNCESNYLDTVTTCQFVTRIHRSRIAYNGRHKIRRLSHNQFHNQFNGKLFITQFFSLLFIFCVFLLLFCNSFESINLCSQIFYSLNNSTPVTLRAGLTSLFLMTADKHLCCSFSDTLYSDYWL